MDNQVIVLAFDLYGTLLSTSSIAVKLASHFGRERADALATLWRRYQLEATWRLNSMRQYQPFSTITRNSLIQSLAESGLSLDNEQVDDLMQAYDELEAFDDVGPALGALEKEAGIISVVFSNGTQAMVESSVQRCCDLAPYKGVFKDLIVVEEVERFKPDPEVYAMLARRVGKGVGALGDIWLISANPFDVVGARAAGMQGIWVDRAGSGWTDAVVTGELGQPTAIVRGLHGVVDAVKREARERFEHSISHIQHTQGD